jgi:hypothetical protein
VGLATTIGATGHMMGGIWITLLAVAQDSHLAFSSGLARLECNASRFQMVAALLAHYAASRV